jgi:hypothetical protein
MIKKKGKLSKVRLRNILETMKYTRKRTNVHTKHHSSYDNPQTTLAKFEFVKKITSALVTRKTLVFIDEMSINNKMIPEYLRVRSSEDIVVNKKEIKQTVSIIAAVSPYELPVFKIFKNCINSQSFGAFLLELVDIIVKKGYNLQDVIFIMDNAPINRAKKIKPLESCINIEFLPSYSPHLNYIEKVFSI